MPIREIPRAFVYTCDGCSAEHLQENAGGHYADSRPSSWSRLKLARTFHDFQGAACADASIERLLCEKCTQKMINAINDTLSQQK